jgi:hypothetical protein
VTDLLGLGSFVPRHARPYADLRGTILAAARSYADDVAAGSFPGPEQSSRMEDAVLDAVLGRTPLDAGAGSRLADDLGVAGIPLDRDL